MIPMLIIVILTGPQAEHGSILGEEERKILLASPTLERPSEPRIYLPMGTGQNDRAKDIFKLDLNGYVREMARGAPTPGNRARVAPAPTTKKAPTDQVRDPDPPGRFNIKKRRFRTGIRFDAVEVSERAFQFCGPSEGSWPASKRGPGRAQSPPSAFSPEVVCIIQRHG